MSLLEFINGNLNCAIKELDLTVTIFISVPSLTIKIVYEISRTSRIRKTYHSNDTKRKSKQNTVELRWLESLWDHENLFETAVVRASECYY